jgi:threonine/homoserine efflux transporter RhtA
LRYESDLSPETNRMTLHLGIEPAVALVAGVLILLMPRLLNLIVAIYLIVVGIVGLTGVHL